MQSCLFKPVEFFPEEQAIFEYRGNCSTAEFAEQHRWIEKSRRRGWWKHKNNPAAFGLMELLDRPETRRIVCKKASGTGVTEVAVNYISKRGYTSNGGESALYVTLDESTGKRIRRQRLLTNFRTSAAFKRLFVDNHSEKSLEDIKLLNEFTVAFGSIGSLGSVTGDAHPIVILDEYAKYKHVLNTGEAKERSKSYEDTRKEFFFSSPEDDSSMLEIDYNSCDEEQKYHVKCPECDLIQVMEFDHTAPNQPDSTGFRWPEGANFNEIRKNNLVWYQCDCGAKWDDDTRKRVVEEAMHDGWWSDNPSETPPTNVAVWFPEWLLPYVSMSETFAAFIEATETSKAKSDESFIRNWINKKAGKTYNSKITELADWELLYNTRRENYAAECPNDAFIITAACDVQKTYVQIAYYGWGLNEEAWHLETEYIQGSVSWPETRRLIQDTIGRKKFKHASGVDLKITTFGIDIGDGTSTTDAQKIVKGFEHLRWYGLKGASILDAPIYSAPSRNNSEKILHYVLGVNTIKTDIFQRIQDAEKGSFGFIHFSDKCDSEFFKQLCSEKKTKESKKGVESVKWEKIRERNEEADLLTYNYGLFKILNPDMGKIKSNFFRGPSQPKTRQRPDSWLK